MNNNEERERKLAKIRKLLAMGRDERGNENEVEAAMRQANKLMAELGIEEAEVSLAALNENTMIFGEAEVRPDGKELDPTKRPKTGDTKWCGILGTGVAKFCDCKVIATTNSIHGLVYKFQGEKQDVLFAAWLFKVLAAAVNDKLHDASWIKARSQRDGFRAAAAVVLHHRLVLLRAERNVILKESGSRALVVVDRKQQEIVARFGEARYTLSKEYAGAAAASGHRAGHSINIPAGRPIEGSSPQARLS